MGKGNILLLGGNTKNNILWIQKTKNVFSKDYEVKEMYYDHWKTDDEINIDAEVKKLEEFAKIYKDYYIISKSIGSIISMMGINKDIIKPKAIIVLGFPLKYMQREKLNMKQTIIDAINKTEILVIQQKNDPIGTYNEVINVLPNNIKVVEIPGNYHVYRNMTLIKQIIDKFLEDQKYNL